MTEQRDLISTFAKLLQNKDLPLIILFASRREYPIQMCFNAQQVDNILKRVPLDNNYQAPTDIRRFLVDSFNDIKLTHPQRLRLKPEWPASEHVQHIVEKSSGQFVYASVVIKFASMPYMNPSTQLDIVRGLRPAGRMTPFAELDVLYRHIFSQIEDITSVLGLLAYAILGSVSNMKRAFYFFGIAEDDAESVLAPLISILSYDPVQDMLVFYHASLPDFLQDQGRSQDYYISTQVWGNELSMLWFKSATSGRFQHLLEGK